MNQNFKNVYKKMNGKEQTGFKTNIGKETVYSSSSAMKADNSDLLKKINGLLERSPAFKECMKALCNLAEKSPEVANKALNEVGKFGLEVGKSYAKHILIQATQPQR